MEFIETDVFTRLVETIITDQEYGCLQAYLATRPEAGDLIPGGRGLRKLRWACREKGKRGGIRVIYYFYSRYRQIYMIYAYKKSKQSDLTPQQLKVLAHYVKDGVL